MSNEKMVVILLVVAACLVVFMVLFLAFHIPFMQASRQKVRQDLQALEQKSDHNTTIIEEKLAYMQVMLDQNRTLLTATDLKIGKIESVLSDSLTSYQALNSQIKGLERSHEAQIKELQKTYQDLSVAFNNLKFNYHQMLNDKKTDRNEKI